jgi:basic amino acid/polyamine antiporter, APA family
VLLVFQLGQPRIFFSMARDGLLPPWAARVHPRYRTPHLTTWLTGILVAVFSGIANINEVVELTNIGTLFAFLLVCVGVTVLRYKDPDRPRGFRVPFGAWLVPMLGAASCIFLMVYLPPSSWWRFIGWLVLGMAVYFFYGYNHSTVGREAGRPERPTGAQRLAALGFLLAGIGLFVIPHDAGLGRLLEEAATAGDPDHGRALFGLILIAGGLMAGVAGMLAGGRRRA